MIAVAEVVENVRSIAVILVAQIDQLAELAAFQLCAAQNLSRVDANSSYGNVVEHDDCARTASASVAAGGGRGMPFARNGSGAFGEVKCALHRHLALLARAVAARGRRPF